MSAKKPPGEKLKPHAVTFSDKEKSEIQEYADLEGISFAEYIRQLTHGDELRRKQEIDRLKAEQSGLVDGHRRRGRRI
jgi:hypothetical protein